MMTLGQFGSFEHVFTDSFRQAVEDIDAAPRQDRYPYVYTEFISEIREALNPIFHVVIPDAVLDIWVLLFTSDDKIGGWVEYTGGELTLAQNTHRPRARFVEVFFHEVQHLIDLYHGYPYIDLAGFSPETVSDESLYVSSSKKYRMQLTERRARRAETGIVRKVYKYYVRNSFPS